MGNAVIESKLTSIKEYYVGKIRDMYDLGPEELLVIASDRISCFDFVLPTPVPEKGIILNKLSLFWFNYLKDIVGNHFIHDDINKFTGILSDREKEVIKDRFMVVKRAKRINIECVVRGYLAGSGFEEYKKFGTVAGIKLPSGLQESDKLPEPLFSPAIKSMSGHDINVTEEQVVDNEGKATTNFLKDKSIKLYEKASKYARERGVIIADTKFEFGIYGDKIILIDEVLTPDSSRFWDVEKYGPGKHQEALDKQFVRDYLISIKWDKQSPVPQLPEDIVKHTQDKYWECYNKLTKK